MLSLNLIPSDHMDTYKYAIDRTTRAIDMFFIGLFFDNNATISTIFRSFLIVLISSLCITGWVVG